MTIAPLILLTMFKSAVQTASRHTNNVISTSMKTQVPLKPSHCFECVKPKLDCPLILGPHVSDLIVQKLT